MLEIILFVGALGAIANRQKQRAVQTSYVAIAGFGWALFFLAGMAIGPAAVILRWLWVGGCYIVLEHYSQGGQKLGDTWQCPDCRLFNDPETLVCLCGYQNPEAELVESPAATPSHDEPTT